MVAPSNFKSKADCWALLPEDEGVLLLVAVVVVLDDHQSQLFLLEVELSDLRPENRGKSD